MSVFDRSEWVAGRQETFSKVIAEGESALYAGLTGDSWEQHPTSRSGENSAPERPIVQPLFLVGMIGGLMNTRILGAGTECITMQYEFLSPVYCGDRIETVIELTEFNPIKHLASFKTNCYNQNRNQVLTGQVVMLVPA